MVAKLKPAIVATAARQVARPRRPGDKIRLGPNGDGLPAVVLAVMPDGAATVRWTDRGTALTGTWPANQLPRAG